MAAERIGRELQFPGVELLRLHQLTPELAESVSQCGTGVIFVDASQKGRPGDICCEPVQINSGEIRFFHRLSPAAILALAFQLYGVTPQAFSVTVVGHDFQHGEGLSPTVSAVLPGLVAKVGEITRQLLSGAASSTHSRDERGLR
jgi:hydrogenase maturation protease